MHRFGKNRNTLLELYPRFGRRGIFSGSSAQLAGLYAVHLHTTLLFYPGPPVCGPERILCVFVMLPDLERYRPFFKKFGLPRELEDQVIHDLWSVALSVGEQAHGHDSVRLCRPGEVAEICRDSGTQVDSPLNRLVNTFAVKAAKGNKGDTPQQEE